MADSLEEVRAAGQELGIAVEDKPGFLSLIQDMLRPESLPEGWTAQFDPETGKRKYINTATGEEQWIHPAIDYYRGAAFMEAGGYRRMLAMESKLPPTEEEVDEMCAYLKIDPSEDAYVKEVAHMAISAPLPEGWEEAEDEQGGAAFRNTVSGELVDHHPLDAYFVELIARRRAELEERGAAVAIKSALSAKRMAAVSSRAQTAVTAVSAATHWHHTAAASHNHSSSGAARTPPSQPQLEEQQRSSQQRSSQQPPANEGGVAGEAGQQLQQQQQSGIGGQSSGEPAQGSQPPTTVNIILYPPGTASGPLPGQSTFYPREAPAVDVMTGAAAAATGTQQQQEGEGSNQEVPPQEDPPEEDMLGPPRSERFLPKEMAEAVAARKAAQKQQQDYLQAYQAAYEQQQAAYIAQLQEAGVIPAPPPGEDQAGADDQSLAGQVNPSSEGPPYPHPPAVPELHLDQLETNPSSAPQQQQQPGDPAAETGGAAGAGGGGQTELLLQPSGSGDDEASREMAMMAALAAADGGYADGEEALPPDVLAARPSRERIRVAVRVRPLANPVQEVAAWMIDPDRATVRLKEHLVGVYRGVKAARTFQFDQVAESQGSTEALFGSHVKPLVEKALKGFNASVLAYGQTGSGKTHTIFGAPGAGLRSGTIGLSLAHIFGAIEVAAMTASCTPWGLHASPSRAVYTPEPQGLLAQEDDRQSAQSQQQQELDGGGGVGGAGGEDGAEQGGAQPVELHSVKISMLELYNEQLRDLLVPSGTTSPALVLADDPRVGIRVQGLTEVEVPGFARAMSLIESGHAARAVGATALNEHSSRSHTIVRVVIETRDAPPAASHKASQLDPAAASAVAAVDGTAGGTSVSAGGALTPGLSFSHTSGHAHITPSATSLSVGGAVKSYAGGVVRSTPSTTAQGAAGQQQQQQQGLGQLKRTTLLHLVDLAGSERLAKTGSTGMRFTEGTNINLSLLMLGTVVARLAEGKRAESFIPYRNSKLTRLLQPCLGGNSCTAIIATINPSHHHVEETVNTLTFATRAMAVTNVVTANSNTPTPGRLQRVTARAAEQNALIAELRSQVTALQLQLRQAQAAIAHAALTPHPPPPAHTSPPGAHTSGRSARQQQQAQGHNQEGKSSRTNGGQQQQQGGANAAGDQQQQAPPVPSLSEKQAAALSKRLDELEGDKAVLLDRLEALTGQPQGGVWEGLPPTPPGLNLPPTRPTRRNVAPSLKVTPEKALRSISRIAALGGRIGQGAGAGAAERLASLAAAKPGQPVEAEPPEDVVLAVRRMRAERDELRRRDARMRAQLATLKESVKALEPFAEQRDAVEECVTLLEDLMGRTSLATGEEEEEDSGSGSAGTGGGKGGDSGDRQKGDLVERLREGVESVVLLNSEMSHIQRQLLTSLALQAAAERRASELEDLWRQTNERASLGMMSPTAGAGGTTGGWGGSTGGGGQASPSVARVSFAAQDGEASSSPGAPAEGAPVSPGASAAAADAAGKSQGGALEPAAGGASSGAKGGLFGGIFGGKKAAPPPIVIPRTNSAAVTAQSQQQQQQQQQELQAASAKHQHEASQAKAQASELMQLVTDMERQQLALREEMAVVKAELARWRGFTDAQDVLDSPTSAAVPAAVQGSLQGGAVHPSGGYDGMAGVGRWASDAAAAAAHTGPGARGNSSAQQPSQNPAAGAGQHQPGQVVVVGSMAVRAAREARARAALLERRLAASEREASELREKLSQIESASGLALGAAGPGKRGGKANRAPPAAERVSEPPGVARADDGQGSGDAGFDAQQGAPAGAGTSAAAARTQAANKERFERVKQHVVSLTREVAALTKERDALLGIVLQAAAAAQQAQQAGAGAVSGGGVGSTPLLMPPDLVQQVFLSNGLVGGGLDPTFGSSAPDMLSLESLLAPPVLAPAPARRGRSDLQRGGAGAQRNRSASPGGGRRSAGAPNASAPPSLYGPSTYSYASSGPRQPGGRSRNNGRQRRRGAPPLPLAPLSEPAAGGSPRPNFDSAPPPLEASRKIQAIEDRMARRGQLSPLKGGGGGAASDSPELQALMGAEMMMGGPGALANVRDVDMLGLKRKLVIAEKARREAEARAGAEVRAAQTQVAAVTRQAAVAARSHAERVKELEVAAEAEVSRVKSEASAAITALMQENARLKALVGERFTLPPPPTVVPLAGVRRP